MHQGKKSSENRLRLNRETIRGLQNTTMEQIEGGNGSIWICVQKKPGVSASCFMACQTTVPTEYLCKDVLVVTTKPLGR